MPSEPELIGQRITGTPLSERDLFVRAIRHIKGLRECWRGLALSRGDMRWLIAARNCEKMEDMTKRLMDKRGPPVLLMPKGRDHGLS